MLEEALGPDHEPRPLQNTTLEEESSYLEAEAAEEEAEVPHRRAGVYKELVPVIGYVSPR
jgi:hypothetical protein